MIAKSPINQGEQTKNIHLIHENQHGPSEKTTEPPPHRGRWRQGTGCVELPIRVTKPGLRVPGAVAPAGVHLGKILGNAGNQ